MIVRDAQGGIDRSLYWKLLKTSRRLRGPNESMFIRSCANRFKSFFSPRMPEKWVDGYQMTNRLIIHIAENFNLSWRTDCGVAFLAAQIHVRNESGIPLRMECLSYRRRPTTIIVFVEDCLKRLPELDYSDEEMGGVRAALELQSPSGTSITQRIPASIVKTISTGKITTLLPPNRWPRRMQRTMYLLIWTNRGEQKTWKRCRRWTAG